MPATDLKLDQAGNLPKPGPLGRLYRLAMAMIVLWFGTFANWGSRNALLAGNFSANVSLFIGLGVGLFLVNYVISIGFSRDWKKWPAAVSISLLGTLAVFDYAVTGDWTSRAFGTGFFLWSMYVYTHLGISFLLAAILSTPGCEMRAFHDLFSKLTGVVTKEHYCPVGIMQPLDNWEAKQAWRKH